MRILLSGKEMKECDRVTIQEFGVSSMVLMERAALACVEELYKSNADVSGKILVVCGSGNNGGDGFAIARLLHLDGRDVTVHFAGKETSCTPETLQQKRICEAYGVNFCSKPQIHEYTVIIDALFGIGLSREVTGTYAELIEKINRSNAFVLAADISSGVHSDTGAILGTAVRADLTVTFAFEKPGHYLGDGREYSGKTVLRQIGITKESLKGTAAHFHCYGREDIQRLPKRPGNAHKGSCGKVLLIAGSREMCGAAVLSAKAAYCMGAGLVRVFTDACNKPVIQQSIPEALVNCCDDGCKENLGEFLDWADAVVIGPGLSMKKKKLEILSQVLKFCSKPLILDADALNLTAAHDLDLTAYRGEILVTPHLGEMARLCQKTIQEIRTDLPAAACEFAKKSRAVCVLKDAGTVVSDGSTLYVNTSGNSGMATGGSGDVLAGMLGALAAQQMPLYDAARLGVYLHGWAGDAAAKQKAMRSMLASDIIEGLSEVLKYAE